MEFSSRKNKSKVFCCVFGYTSQARRNDTVRFFHFPEEGKNLIKFINKFGTEEAIDRRTAWIKVLKMGKKVSASMRVFLFILQKKTSYHQVSL